MKKIFFAALLALSIGEIACQDKPKKEGNSQQNASIINETINVDDFQKKLAENKNVQLIDVRTPEEYNEGHLKGALNVDYKSDDFATKIAGFDKNKITMVYCLGGGRSSAAAEQMQQMGFTTIYNMQGGIMKWNAANKALDYPSSALDREKPGMSITDYNKMVVGENDKYVLVDFNAKWCMPCQKMKPMLKKMRETKSEKLTINEIDADDNKGLLREKKIDAIPYFELYKNGKLVWKHNGYMDEETFLRETGL